MALDYELQSRKLLILFTSVRRWYLSKAMMSVWGHQFFHKYPFNTLICKQLLLTDDVGVYFMVYKQMPPVVLAIPFFIMLGKFSLLDTLVGLILVYIVLLMPIAVWIMVDFFNKVPRELDETALIDGCDPYQAFYKVVLPNSIPGIVVAGMFCMIFGWTDFFFSFILTFTEVQLLPVAIVALNSSITPWWSLSAAALVSVAPLVVVAFVVERFLSKGNLSGALK